MRRIKLFEEFNIKNRKEIKDASHTGGAKEIMSKFGSNKKATERHLKKLDSSMEEVSKSFGLSGPVKYIDSGSFGMAFSCGEYVIKLTSDKREVNQVNILIGKDIPGCVKYYKIMYNDDYDLWAIMMDKVEQLTRNQIITINSVQKYLKKKNKKGNSKNLIHLLDSCTIEDYILYLGMEDGGKDSKKIEAIEKIFNDFKDLVEKLSDYDVTMDDIHSGNVGYKNGQMIAFDIMSKK